MPRRCSPLGGGAQYCVVIEASKFRPEGKLLPKVRVNGGGEEDGGDGEDSEEWDETGEAGAAAEEEKEAGGGEDERRFRPKYGSREDKEQKSLLLTGVRKSWRALGENECRGECCSQWSSSVYYYIPDTAIQS